MAISYRIKPTINELVRVSLNLHRMQMPREIIIGNGSLDLIGDVCDKLELSERALIVTGKNTLEVAAVKIIKILEDEGFQVACQVLPSRIPTLKDVDFSVEKISKFKPKVVFGVGGGSKIDVAKLSSARQNIPFVSVPTSPSHDGIASPFASIKGLCRPYSAIAQSPIAVVADTSIMMEVPYRFVASGCGDMVAKFTSTRDWKIAHERKHEYYAQYTTSISRMGAQHIVDNAVKIKPSSEEGLRILLEALVSCGIAMGIAGTSKPCSGSEHLFSHALDLIVPSPALHGEQCGVGAIMMAYLHNIDWETIRNTLIEVGAPVTAENLGIESKYILEALAIAPKIRPERYTILSEKSLNQEMARELARETGVIK